MITCTHKWNCIHHAKYIYVINFIHEDSFIHARYNSLNKFYNVHLFSIWGPLMWSHFIHMHAWCTFVVNFIMNRFCSWRQVSQFDKLHLISLSNSSYGLIRFTRGLKIWVHITLYSFFPKDVACRSNSNFTNGERVRASSRGTHNLETSGHWSKHSLQLISFHTNFLANDANPNRPTFIQFNSL